MKTGGYNIKKYIKIKDVRIGNECVKIIMLQSTKTLNVQDKIDIITIGKIDIINSLRQHWNHIKKECMIDNYKFYILEKQGK